MVKEDRAAGLLLHPTSLPGPFGIGELGPEAHRFIDALSAAGGRLWQILPLGPVSNYGHSPYSSYSAFAGNPLLVSIETLLEEEWLTPRDMPPFPGTDNVYRVDFDRVAAWKYPTLRACYHRFQKKATSEEQSWFLAFCHAREKWLDDYALFMAIKDEQDDKGWNEWPAPLRDRAPEALAEKREKLADEIQFQKFMQFLFDRQWEGIRNHCAEAGVLIIGDVPIFVAMDSADVWTHQELFFLDDEGSPTVVAGVPPDYFCSTGQLWGNPLYDWKAHQADNYSWWMERLEATFAQVDIVRIDHFRGLEAYWEVPAGDKTAENGRWVEGPGAHFLAAVQDRFGELPIIAEDLGVITAKVDALRENFGLPGMRVLQFAFTGEDPKEATHIPHNHCRNSIVYSGTHDNDTAVGWYYGQDSIDPRSPEQQQLERQNFLNYIGLESTDHPHWRMIMLALGSVAETAVIPVQDVLGLGSDARMNRPGNVVSANWAWRLSSDQLDLLAAAEIRDKLKTLIWRFGRL